MRLVLHLLTLLHALASDRSRLALENLVLRQQLNVLRRGAKRARLDDSDRVFWVLVHRLFKDWKDHLVIVKPETVIRWHRQGFRYYWRWKSRAKPGRPSIPMEVIHLIRRMSIENVALGRSAHPVRARACSVTTSRSRPSPSTWSSARIGSRRQSWRTFLANHMNVSAACDFFTVPTLTFKVLYVFVVLSHDRRRIVHVNVTKHPTAEWAAQQITEAFPGGREPRYLHRDGDASYGDVFCNRIAAMGIPEIVNAKQSPWQNPFVERAIGSIRRECLRSRCVSGAGQESARQRGPGPPRPRARPAHLLRAPLHDSRAATWRAT